MVSPEKIGISFTFPLTLSKPLKIAPSAISVFTSCDTKQLGKKRLKIKNQIAGLFIIHPCQLQTS